MNLTVAKAFKNKDMASTASTRSACAPCKPQRMQTRRGRPTTPTVGAAHRSVFQLVVGASRQRAAPRNQFTNAANDTLAPLIGYRGPRSTSATESSLIPSQSTGPSKCNPSQMQMQVCASRHFLAAFARCGLTLRSTGHFAAVQVWAKKS